MSQRNGPPSPPHAPSPPGASDARSTQDSPERAPPSEGFASESFVTVDPAERVSSEPPQADTHVGPIGPLLGGAQLPQAPLAHPAHPAAVTAPSPFAAHAPPAPPAPMVSKVPTRRFIALPTPAVAFTPPGISDAPPDESWDEDDAPTMGPTPLPHFEQSSLMGEHPPDPVPPVPFGNAFAAPAPTRASSAPPPPHPQPPHPQAGLPRASSSPLSPRPPLPRTSATPPGPTHHPSLNALPHATAPLAISGAISGANPVANSGAPASPPAQSLAVRTDLPREHRPAPFHVVRSRAYSFVLDARGMPIEVGSGRFAKAFLGEERWLESKTDFRREVVIKILQRGVADEDHMRFQMEKELLERVQGHPNIVHLFASGEAEDPEFLPPSIRDHVESDFVILERLEMSLEERLKGSRSRGKKDDLLACDMRERVFRVLDYVIPIASAIEYAHLIRNICHRDIKPANILIRLPDPNLRGGTLEVRLADFNVSKLNDEEINFGVTRLRSVPGTLFFQSPEQETNTIELLVNVQQGSAEVEFFEDFYIQIAKNDTFSLFNRNETYPILYADRSKKRIVLGRPYKDVSESNVRAKIQKSVGRPADIYSLGALLYYLATGAYGNPKTLYDAFHKFIEYERIDENNTIEAYLEHEYSVIRSLSAPQQMRQQGDSNAPGDIDVAPADRFFSYKHYLDGNGELVDPYIMKIIAKCMIRNKPDSYCQAHEIDTRGISSLTSDLIDLYSIYGVHPAARPANIARRHQGGGGLMRPFSRFRLAWLAFTSLFRKRR